MTETRDIVAVLSESRGYINNTPNSFATAWMTPSRAPLPVIHVFDFK